MHLEIIVLSEVSQAKKDISYDIAYMWNLKKKYKKPFIICKASD